MDSVGEEVMLNNKDYITEEFDQDIVYDFYLNSNEENNNETTWNEDEQVKTDLAMDE